MTLEVRPAITAARLCTHGNVFTIVYANGELTTEAFVDPDEAADYAQELGLTPGGTSSDGVRFWWR